METYSPNRNNLPVEMILKIMAHLDVKTLKNASLVNRQWFELTRRRIEEKAALKLNSLWVLPENVDRASRNYTSVQLVNIDSEHILRYLQYIDPSRNRIKEMALMYIDVTYGDFLTAMKWCKNLSKLSLSVMRIKGDYVLSDAVISVDTLNINVMHPLPPIFGRVKNFTVVNGGCDVFIQTVIAMNRTTLTKVQVSFSNLRNYNDLLGIANLESLTLHNFSEEVDYLRQILTHYPNMKHLALTVATYVTDANIGCIAALLQNLDSLKIGNCGELTDNVCAIIGKMKSLKTLEMDSKVVPRRGFRASVDKSMPNLSKLKLKLLKCQFPNHIFENFLIIAPNLTSIYLDSHTEISNQSFLQMAHVLKKLKSLTLRYIKNQPSSLCPEMTTIPEFESLESLLHFGSCNDDFVYNYLNAPRLKTLQIPVISFNGQSFVDRFPLLEYLVLKCNNLTDSTVDIICQGLPRLRYLDICESALTTTSVQSVVIYCRNLISCNMNLDFCDSKNRRRDDEYILTDIGKLRSPAMTPYIMYRDNFISGLKNELLDIRFLMNFHFRGLRGESEDEDKF